MNRSRALSTEDARQEPHLQGVRHVPGPPPRLSEALKQRDDVRVREFKLAMKDHSTWFLGNRAELDRLRVVATRLFG